MRLNPPTDSWKQNRDPRYPALVVVVAVTPPPLRAGVELDDLLNATVLSDIARAKLIAEDAPQEFDALNKRITGEIGAMARN